MTRCGGIKGGIEASGLLNKLPVDTRASNAFNDNDPLPEAGTGGSPIN